MRIRPRDVVSSLGFLSLALSLWLGPVASFANVPVKSPMPQTAAVGADGMGRGMQPPESLKLNLEGRDIVTIYATGNVAIADDLTVNEASRDFWRKVGELAPSFCKSRATETHQRAD